MPTTVHNVWWDDLDVPELDNVTVKAGESVEVEDDGLAKRMLAQEDKWRSARSVSAEKAAKKKES
jgi:hypothetical protein